MGEVTIQQLAVGGLGFALLDYGGRVDIPMELRTLLNECGNLEKDHCSIARLAEGIERHIQKRPIGPPVQTRVISMAADLRINEYGRAVGILRFNSDADVESVEWEIAGAVRRDAIIADHDRDFRVWALFVGKEIEDRQMRIRIVEIDTQETGHVCITISRAATAIRKM